MKKNEKDTKLKRGGSAIIGKRERKFPKLKQILPTLFWHMSWSVKINKKQVKNK